MVYLFFGCTYTLYADCLCELHMDIHHGIHPLQQPAACMSNVWWKAMTIFCHCKARSERQKVNKMETTAHSLFWYMEVAVLLKNILTFSKFFKVNWLIDR